MSALDIVPGDVIPIAAARKRSWYNSVQFRAALAAAFVASASLLLRRMERDEVATVMDNPATEIAASSAQPSPAASPVPDRLMPFRICVRLSLASLPERWGKCIQDVESALEQRTARAETRRAATAIRPQ